MNKPKGTHRSGYPWASWVLAQQQTSMIEVIVDCVYSCEVCLVFETTATQSFQDTCVLKSGIEV